MFTPLYARIAPDAARLSLKVHVYAAGSEPVATRQATSWRMLLTVFDTGFHPAGDRDRRCGLHVDDRHHHVAGLRPRRNRDLTLLAIALAPVETARRAIGGGGGETWIDTVAVFEPSVPSLTA